MKQKSDLISADIAEILGRGGDGIPTPEMVESIEYLLDFLQNDTIYDTISGWVSDHVFEDDDHVTLYYHMGMHVLILSSRDSRYTILTFGDTIFPETSSPEYRAMADLECIIKRTRDGIDIMIDRIHWQYDASWIPDISDVVSKRYVTSKTVDPFACWIYDRIKDRKKLSIAYAKLSKNYTAWAMQKFIQNHKIDIRLKSDNENSLCILRDIAAIEILSTKIPSESGTNDFLRDVLAIYSKPKKINKVSYAMEQRGWYVYICKHLADTKCKVYTSYKV